MLVEQQHNKYFDAAGMEVKPEDKADRAAVATKRPSLAAEWAVV